MSDYLTYLYLLTPLHTGGSANEGNLMGIAREVHTEFPYLPASSVRGKLRATVERNLPEEYKKQADLLFGQRIEGGQQPTEGEVWFADASLLFFPVASYSHQYLWITCPLWLGRWCRWIKDDALEATINGWRDVLSDEAQPIKAIASVAAGKQVYLQGAIIEASEVEEIDSNGSCWSRFTELPGTEGIFDLKRKLIILSDADCGVLLETGLQREVRIKLESNSKTVEGGSFRSEEAIPPETMMFFSWGVKSSKDARPTQKARDMLELATNQRLQFGGLESIGRGWAQANSTVVGGNGND